ncbi:MAG: hypothetical protein ACRDRI_05065 [Pseudonocardiaceae bacterium]
MRSTHSAAGRAGRDPRAAACSRAGAALRVGAAGDTGGGGDREPARLRGGAAAIADQELYTAEVFDACPELRLMVRFGVGFDTVDVGAATERGVLVATIPGTNDGGSQTTRSG